MHPYPKQILLIDCALTAIALLPFPSLYLAHTENQLSITLGFGFKIQTLVLLVVCIESIYFWPNILTSYDDAEFTEFQLIFIESGHGQ